MPPTRSFLVFVVSNTLAVNGVTVFKSSVSVNTMIASSVPVPSVFGTVAVRVAVPVNSASAVVSITLEGSAIVTVVPLIVIAPSSIAPVLSGMVPLNVTVFHLLWKVNESSLVPFAEKPSAFAPLVV